MRRTFLSASCDDPKYGTIRGFVSDALGYNPAMRRTRLFAIALPLLVIASPSRPAKTVVQLKDAQGKSVGTAILSEHKPGVELDLHVENLPPGEHAVHFHREPKCEGPGLQVEPARISIRDLKKHGLDNPEGHHNGGDSNFPSAPTAKRSSAP